MAYPMTDEDREIQARVRRVRRRRAHPPRGRGRAHRRQAPRRRRRPAPRQVRELGFGAINMPKELGGDGFTIVPAGAGPGAGRPGHQCARVGRPHPAGLAPAGRHGAPARAWVAATIRGERRECYAITEEGAGSDVGRHPGHRPPGRRRVRSERREVARHLRSTIADYVFFQGELTEGPHAGEARDVRGRHGHARHPRGPDAALLAHPRPPPPHRGLRGRPGAGAHLIGAEGDGMTFVYEWFRYERLMIGARCCGAAERLDRGGDGVRHGAASRTDVPIAKYQAIQFMLADSLAELWAARLMTYQTAQGHRRRRRQQGPARASARWPSCTPPRWPAGSPTGRCRSSAAAATCGRTWPSASSGSCASNGSGKGPRRSSESIIADQLYKRGDRPRSCG